MSEKSKKCSNEDKNEIIDIDWKSKTVFAKKGYEFQSKLGSGAFGQVYRARNFKTNLDCAVKVINLDSISENICKKFVPRELSALMEVKHPNAISVCDIIRINRRIYIFMEYACNGDLKSYVKKNNNLDESLACLWFEQICQAVNHFHTVIHMAHRDIKLENILLDQNMNCKLTDFGFANLMLNDNDDINNVLSETFCGTVPYYSPQLTAHRPYNPFKADVWAIGVVLYTMLHNRYPFHYKDVKNMHREQADYPCYIQSRFSAKISSQAQDLMLKMFEPNETKRISMNQVLTHEWLTMVKAKTITTTT